MKKKEIIWVLATLAVTAIAWTVYCMFIEEEYVEAGSAPVVEMIDTDGPDTTNVEDNGMDLSQFSSVGDEDEQ